MGRKIRSLLSIILSASISFAQANISRGSMTSGSAAASLSQLPIDFVIAPATATPAGSDANPCTLLLPCLTPQHVTSVVRGMPSGKHVVALRGGDYFQDTPWTFTAADNGTLLRPIVYDSYPGEQANITGGRVVSFAGATTDGSFDCGPTCTAKYVTLDADPSHPNYFPNFSDLIYNDKRRPRPQARSGTDGWLTNNGASITNAAPFCVAGANQAAADAACGCLAGSGPCTFDDTPCSAPTPHKCYNKFPFSGTDIDGTWHGLGLGDLELLDVKRWTMERLRLDSVPAAGVALLKGPMALFPNASGGVQSGGAFVVENVREKAKKGQWYLDRCPGCAANVTTPALTQRLYIFVDTSIGENPATATIIVPGQHNGMSLLVANSLQNIIITGIKFSIDSWMPGPLGSRDTSGMPQVPAALSFTDSSNISLNGNLLQHLQQWAIEFKGASNGNRIENNTLYDINAGGIRVGATYSVSDTNANTPGKNTIRNNQIAKIGRKHPSGEGPVIWIGDAHGMRVDHNAMWGTFAGCINGGQILNIGTGNPPVQGFAYDNWYTNNDCYGELNGSLANTVVSDYGGIHATPSLSSLCPAVLDGTLTPHLTPTNTYCTHIIGNRFHDLAHNYDNVATQGSQGVYLEQGTHDTEVRNNTIYRISHRCFFNSVPDTTPPESFSHQHNLVENNVISGCGGIHAQNQSVINRSGSNGESFTFRKNIVVTNTAVSSTMRNMSAPGHWSPFADDGTTAIAPSTRFKLELNDWFNVASSNAQEFGLCKTSACTGAYNSTNYTIFGPTAGALPTSWTACPWQVGPPYHACEDGGSISIDPQFVNKTFGVDNYHPQANLSAIGFVDWNQENAGTLFNLYTVPAVPDLFPLRTVDMSTDFF